MTHNRTTFDWLVTSGLFGRIDEIMEKIAIPGASVGIMVHQPEKGESMEVLPHMAIATIGDDAIDMEMADRLFSRNFAVLGKIGHLEAEHMFDDGEGVGVVYNVTLDDVACARVVLSVELPEGVAPNFDERQVVRDFAEIINEEMWGFGESDATPRATSVVGRLYEGGAAYNDRV